MKCTESQVRSQDNKSYSKLALNLQKKTVYGVVSRSSNYFENPLQSKVRLTIPSTNA